MNPVYLGSACGPNSFQNASSTGASKIGNRYQRPVILLAFLMALITLPLLGQIGPPKTSARHRAQHFDAVHAVGGKVFGLAERSDGSIDVTWIETAAPAADAYGLSPDGEEVVYMPLEGEIATGELWRERLSDHERSRVTSSPIITAAVGPREPFTVAFTRATDSGYAASVVDVRTGREVAVPESYLMPDYIRVDERAGVHYFEEDDPLLAADATTEGRVLRPAEFDAASGRLDRRPTVGQRELYLAEGPASGGVQSESLSASTAFAVDSGTFVITGETLLGETSLAVRDRETEITRDLGSGALLDVLRNGAVIRRITPTSSYIEYVPWTGKSMVIGTNATLSFTLPMQTATLTQNGTGYSAPCGIMDHSGALQYAYDLQNSTSGAHVFAVAPGSIVSAVTNVTCNSYPNNTKCPIWTSSCAGNGGWGNSIVYRLSDGTYIRTAHHMANSYQSGASTALCAGRYYEKQGSTGRTLGNMDGCGAHVHIQRQTGADSSTSSPLYFSEFNNTGGTCLKLYTSGTKEVASCPVTVLSENVEGGAPGWSYSTSIGAGWGVETTAYAHSGSKRFRSNYGRSSYTNFADASVISPAFSLSGSSSATLTFWTKYRTEANNDYFRIEASVNGGAWQAITKFSGVSPSYDSWSLQTVGLNQFCGYSNVRLRFRLTADWLFTDVGVMLDDIQVIAQQ